MLNKIKFAGAALSLMIFAGSAQAAITTIKAVSTSELDVMVTFDNPAATSFQVPDAMKARPGIYEGVTGNKIRTYGSPFAQATNDGDSPFTSATFTALRFANATYEFGASQTDLSVLWGSPGGADLIELFLGTVSVATVNGVEVNAVRTAAQKAVTNLSFLVSISDVIFDKAVFTNTDGSFEYANLATSSTLAQVIDVPSPASGILLLSGFGAVFFLRRKKTL